VDVDVDVDVNLDLDLGVVWCGLPWSGGEWRGGEEDWRRTGGGLEEDGNVRWREGVRV
jgi:hypothetical protein